MTKRSETIEGIRQNTIVMILQLPMYKYARPIIILPTPNDIYNAIEYFCRKDFQTVSPITVIVILMHVSDPNPAKNKPAQAIVMLTAPLNTAIPKTVIDQANTIENLRPKLSVK